MGIVEYSILYQGMFRWVKWKILFYLRVCSDGYSGGFYFISGYVQVGIVVIYILSEGTFRWV